VAGRENGYPRNMRRRIVRKTVAEYQKWMNRFADMGNLDVWYAHFNADALHLEFYPRIAKAQVTMVEQSIAKARTRDNIHELEKLTVVINGERRIISDPPLIVPVEELVQGAERKALEAIIRQGIRSYRRTLVSDRKYLLDEYQYVHLARKVVGVGSVGLRAWIVLFHGRDNGDPLFLQVKEAQPSILEPHAAKSKFRNHGQRVVSGQRLMQAASDIFLGWGRMTIQNGDVHDFYVRQLKDWKGSFHVESMTPEGMELYGRMCGWTLARAHARSGERVAIAGYLGSGKMFQNAIAAFSEAYADQNERDYLKLVEASKAGRINAELGL
jgi:uncharacterized protein (DUF2252 family)